MGNFANQFADRGVRENAVGVDLGRTLLVGQETTTIGYLSVDSQHNLAARLSHSKKLNNEDGEKT